MRRIPMGALHHFEAVARLKSFSLAANELNLSQGAVSQQIRALEDRLSRALFVREHGKLRLSAEGEKFYPVVREALAAIDDGVNQITGAPGAATLKIGALPTVGSHWLIPRLGSFVDANPKLSIEVVSLPADFVLNGFYPRLDVAEVDIAITYGEGNWISLNAVKLFNEHVLAVASPEYLRRQPVHDIADLAACRLIQHTTRPNMWRRWAAEHGPARLDSGAGPAFEHFFMVVEAAKAGLGVALLPAMFIERELAEGALVRLLDASLQSPASYFLAWPAARDGEPAIRAMVSWVIAQAEAFHAPQQGLPSD